MKLRTSNITTTYNLYMKRNMFLYLCLIYLSSYRCNGMQVHRRNHSPSRFMNSCCAHGVHITVRLFIYFIALNAALLFLSFIHSFKCMAYHLFPVSSRIISRFISILEIHIKCIFICICLNNNFLCWYIFSESKYRLQ